MSIQRATHTGYPDGGDGFRPRWCGTRIYYQTGEYIGRECTADGVFADDSQLA
jgi:hypothetical protein